MIPWVFFPQEAGRQEGPRRVGTAGGGRALRTGLDGVGQPAGGLEGVAGSRSAVPGAMGWKGWFFLGMCYLSLCKYMYIYIHTVSVYIYIHIHICVIV